MYLRRAPLHKQPCRLSKFSSGEDDSDVDQRIRHKPSDLAKRMIQQPWTHTRGGVGNVKMEIVDRIRPSKPRISILPPLHPNRLIARRFKLKNDREKAAVVMSKAISESPFLRAMSQIKGPIRFTQWSSVKQTLDFDSTGSDSDVALPQSVRQKRGVPEVRKGGGSDGTLTFSTPGPLNESVRLTKERADEVLQSNDDKSGRCPSQGDSILKKRIINSQKPVNITSEFKTSEENTWFSVPYQKLSMIMVTVVLLFFIMLGVIYSNISVHSGDSIDMEFGRTGDFYPLCNLPMENEDFCVEAKHMNQALHGLKVLCPKLLEVATEELCNPNIFNAPVRVSMSEQEAIEYIVRTVPDLKPLEAKLTLRNVKILILANPHWEVMISDHYCTDRDVTHSHERKLALLEQGGLAVRHPILPITCKLRRYIRGFSNWKTYTVTSFTFFGLVYALWWYKKYQDTHLHKVYILVNKILSFLRTRHEKTLVPGILGSQFISVEASKQEILKRFNGQGLMTAWNDAVSFIEKYELQVCCEVQSILGKKVKRWKYVSSTLPINSSSSKRAFLDAADLQKSPSYRKKDNYALTKSELDCDLQQEDGLTKVWHGQAFETIAGSPNSLPFSPTPCLKIRHMFDPVLENGKHWPLLIQDAILEKCEKIHVLHIFVEHTSPEGLVYIKCSSQEEAGKAYRVLHGWWFNKKLITVKYLRLERYHQRFPGAVEATRHLSPSNNLRLSMQELYKYNVECV